jgi:hypothetical protein
MLIPSLTPNSRAPWTLDVGRWTLDVGYSMFRMPARLVRGRCAAKRTFDRGAKLRFVEARLAPKNFAGAIDQEIRRIDIYLIGISFSQSTKT